MDKIILNKVEITANKISYKYTIEGDWKKYFYDINEYSMEYTENIDGTPKSIACIPFITNILPMVWIFDANLIIEEIDKDFYESINKFKEGYIKMYPMLSFKGKFKYKKIVDNSYKATSNVASFYSGGLDATSTLVTHYKEKPMLINLQGSDLNLKYKNVINDVQKFLQDNADNLGLDIVFIKSEFRAMLDEQKLTKMVMPIIHDNYWHALQHGIAIIGHAAPLSYKYKMKTVYIASSFTKEDNVRCASDPTIDNYVKLSSTNVVHDGFSLNRNDKSENIGNFIKKTNKKIKLRVCLDDHRVDNCCNCEKCYRTILGFASKGYEPQIVGFNLNNKFYKKVERDFKYKIIVEFIPYWKNIQNEFFKHPELKEDERFKWIYNFDFDNCNKKPIKYIIKYILKVYNAILKRIKKFIEMLIKRDT